MQGGNGYIQTKYAGTQYMRDSDMRRRGEKPAAAMSDMRESSL